MNELTALAIIGAYMAIAYFFVYPKAKGIVGLRWLDLLFSVLAIGSVTIVYGIDSEPGNFLNVPWPVFALFAYVVLETPAWFIYMKAHPEQGTLAQLYGFTKSYRDNTAKNVDRVMNDTKWDSIRTSRAQRVLVILGAVSLIGAPTLFWFEDYIKPGIGILAVIPIFLIWWLLRISVRLVADAPDELLDEFQVSQRDRTYLYSFRALAGIVTSAAIALMIFTFSIDYKTVGNVDYYQIELTFGQVNAIIWLVLGSVILIPNMVLAWNQSKGVKL